MDIKVRELFSSKYYENLERILEEIFLVYKHFFIT